MRADRRTVLLIIGALGLLIIPLVAMAFTDEVRWCPGDFVVAGALLTGLALGIGWILRKVVQLRYRLLLAGLLLMAVLFLWAEMAVGLVGSPLAGN